MKKVWSHRLDGGNSHVPSGQQSQISTDTRARTAGYLGLDTDNRDIGRWRWCSSGVGLSLQ